jgi:hypothetical protein
MKVLPDLHYAKMPCRRVGRSRPVCLVRRVCVHVVLKAKLSYHWGGSRELLSNAAPLLITIFWNRIVSYTICPSFLGGDPSFFCEWRYGVYEIQSQHTRDKQVWAKSGWQYITHT